MEETIFKARLTGLYNQWKEAKSKDWREGKKFDEWLISKKYLKK